MHCHERKCFRIIRQRTENRLQRGAEIKTEDNTMADSKNMELNDEMMAKAAGGKAAPAGSGGEASH